jgi:hypothetical protein
VNPLPGAWTRCGRCWPDSGRYPPRRDREALGRVYVKAIWRRGCFKVMSKMGISTPPVVTAARRSSRRVGSDRGARGTGRHVHAARPSAPRRGGVRRAAARGGAPSAHARASGHPQDAARARPIVAGLYPVAPPGRAAPLEPAPPLALLQGRGGRAPTGTRSGQFSAAVRRRDPAADPTPARRSARARVPRGSHVPLARGASRSSPSSRRFVTGAMSFREASAPPTAAETHGHRDEPPRWPAATPVVGRRGVPPYGDSPDDNGGPAPQARIKQVASARFGVSGRVPGPTPTSCRIKIASRARQAGRVAAAARAQGERRKSLRPGALAPRPG